MNWVLASAGIVAAPFIGGLIFGLDRKMTARLQGRQGPPIIQPFYDFLKLWSKDSTYTNRRQIFYLYTYLLWMIISLIILITGQDFMLFVFTLAFSEISLVLAGFATRSPYSHIGSNRELLQILAAEPVLLFLAYALYLKNGSFLVAGVYLAKKPMLFSYPLLFIALLMILTIKMRKSPFDISTSAHAHQEIVRGIFTEFSGRYLALTELAHWIEIAIVLFIVFLFWANPWWAGVLLALGAYALEIIIDNIYARMRIGWMVSFAWASGFVLSLVNILFNIAARRV
ncbi:MAG: respiratory chain complex I subunit 1 family protein [Candidatus Saccharibacteria bacterium]